MIKALIENYETLTIVGVFGIVMAWYLWHQTKYQTKREEKHDEQQAKREEKHDKQQDEDRGFHRNLITNVLKDIHNNSLENSKLNSQSLILQKNIIDQLDEHNGHSRKAWDKTNKSLSAICDKLNGVDPKKKDNKTNERKK